MHHHRWTNWIIHSIWLLSPVSLSIRELVQTWDDSWEIHSSKDRVTGEKGPATELELRTYVLSWSFSHELLVPVEILRPQTPFITGHGCAAIQRSRPMPRGWYCARCDGSRLAWAWIHEPEVEVAASISLCVSLSIRELVQTWDDGWEIHSSKDRVKGEKGGEGVGRRTRLLVLFLCRPALSLELWISQPSSLLSPYIK